MISLTDLELVAQAELGSPQALAEIVRRHQPAVRGFLRRLCLAPEEADDLAQETFLAALASLATFRSEASFRSWLCGIAYRKFRMSNRSAARRIVREKPRSLAPTAEFPAPERQMDVRAAFRALGDEQRAAAALCLASDMSHSEAAAALGIPLGTLKSRVASARRALMKALEDYQ